MEKFTHKIVYFKSDIAGKQCEPDICEKYEHSNAILKGSDKDIKKKVHN